MRLGLAASTSSSPAWSLPFSTSIRTRSPGRVNGTKIGPSGPCATPSPCAPRRVISTSSSIAGADQEFLVAAAAEDRRGDLPQYRPAPLPPDKRPHRLHRL